MSNVLHMFPGQGSQSVGMGKESAEKEEIVRDVFTNANKITGMDIAKLCFEGPDDELKKTQNTQPCIFTYSYALAMLMAKKGYTANYLAGHSLGEYTAVTLSGMLDFESALKLIVKRGQLMANAGVKNPGSMAAVMGVASDDLDKICAEASADGIVVCANYNNKDQIVISGSVAGVQKAMELAKAKGAKRAILLPVSGAFHSPLMAEAAEEYYAELKKINFSDAKIPVITNVLAEPTTSGSQMRDLLFRQLTSPVKWVTCVEKAHSLGVKTALEIGPGKVLSGLVKRIVPDINALSIEDSQAVSNYN